MRCSACKHGEAPLDSVYYRTLGPASVRDVTLESLSGVKSRQKLCNRCVGDLTRIGYRQVAHEEKEEKS